MKNTLVSLHEVMKELLLSDLKNISHVTFFIEKEGMTKIPFDEFDKLTSNITIDSGWLNDIHRLISIFGDNFCFVYKDGSIKYIYHIDEEPEHRYQMRSIDPVSENSRWKSYTDDYKKNLITKSINLPRTGT